MDPEQYNELPAGLLHGFRAGPDLPIGGEPDSKRTEAAEAQRSLVELSEQIRSRAGFLRVSRSMSQLACVNVRWFGVAIDLRVRGHPN